MSAPGHLPLGALLPYHVDEYAPAPGRTASGGLECIMRAGPFEERVEPAPEPDSAHHALTRARHQKYLVCKPNGGTGGAGPGAWASNSLPIAGAYTGETTTMPASTIVPKRIADSVDTTRSHLNVAAGITRALAERWEATDVCPNDAIWLYACTMLAGVCADDSETEPLERPVPITAIGWLGVRAMQVGRFLEGSAIAKLPRSARWTRTPPQPPPWGRTHYDFDNATLYTGCGGILCGVSAQTWRLRIGKKRALEGWLERNTGVEDCALRGDSNASETVLRTIRNISRLAIYVHEARTLRAEIERNSCLMRKAP